jgi:uncharacterized membrane protein
MTRKGETRIWEIDFLRGFSIIMMVWDHLMYDLKSMPSWFADFNEVNRPVIEWIVGFAGDYWYGDLRAMFHYVFVGIFLVVSGISFTFSHSNLARSLKFLVFAAMISAVTFTVDHLFDLGISVFFGIIHMFALGTFLTWLLRKIWNNDIFMFVVGTAVIVLGFIYCWGSAVTVYLDVTWDNFLSIIIGTGAFGADDFGLMPFAGVIMIGTVIGNRLYKTKKSLLPALDGKWNRPVNFAGRHTLFIVVTHQIILSGLVFLIGFLAGYHI